MAYRKNQTNAQIVSLALKGMSGETSTGNMSAQAVDNFESRFGYVCAPVGKMPISWANLLRERWGQGKVSQVIRSYGTAIAWLDAEHGWIVPDVSYSVTTSTKHQSQLHRLPNARRIAAPYDATGEDMRRVLAGELAFTSKGYGLNRVFTGTVPGPNYRPEFPAFRSTVVHEDGTHTERWTPGRIILDSDRGLVNGGI